MEREFNPYDLNDVANIDKFIKRWEEGELRKLIQKAHPRPRPAPGTRRDLFKNIDPPQQGEPPQSGPDSTEP